MRNLTLAAAVLFASGCQTIPLGEPSTSVGWSRDRFLHVVSLPFDRRAILIRDNGTYWCWGTPKGTSCKPAYTGDAIRTKPNRFEP